MRKPLLDTQVKESLPTGGLLLCSEQLKWNTLSFANSASGPLSEKQIYAAESTAKKIVVKKIVYKSNGHRVHGFIVEPKKIIGLLPCIIWNRGGTNEYGALTPWQVFTILGMFASWGYIVIGSQYSGNAGGEGVDECGGSDLNDVLSLRQILKRHTQADTKRIGMYGGSRGGMMTYLCLSKVKWIGAAVTSAGMADLERQMNFRPEMKERFKTMFGAHKNDIIARSAVRWADAFCKTTPLLMMHGTNDNRVSPLDSLDLSALLLKAGIHHRLVLFEGDDHFLTAHRKEKWSLVKAWFERFLKEGERIHPNI